MTTILRHDRILAEAPQRLRIRCALTDVFVRDVQVSTVFFYDRPLEPDALVRGLSHVLGDFAPFNARLRREGLEHFIECGETGATFAVVRSERTLNETLANLDAATRRSLVEIIEAKHAWSNGDPVLAFRLTQFADGTSALGMSWHHSVGDWHSVMYFMKSWSRAVAGLEYEKPLVVEDRDAYLNDVLSPNDAPPNLRFLKLPELLKLGGYLVTKGRDKRRVTLFFDRDELERMRARLQEQSGRRLSINDSVSAHVCSVISARDVKQRDRRLSIAVDFRKRAALPLHLIGNLVTSVEADYARGERTDVLAAALRSGVDDFSDKFLNHRSNLEFVRSHGGVKNIGRFIPTAIDPFAGSLLVSNWSGVGIYELDFGGAPPSQFITAGSGPLPWLGVMHEGFRNRGLIFDLELPSAVVARMVDADGQREVHRYREPDLRAQPEASPAWFA